MTLINKTKKGWLTVKNNLTKEIYTKEKTLGKLLINDYYLSLLGKAKNRTLMKNDPILYNSIYEYTSSLNELNKNNNKFSIRILFLVKDNGEINKIKCKECNNNLTTFNYDKGYFNERCIDCFNTNKIKYPTIGWFKLKYNDDWEYHYNLDRKLIKDKKVGSKEWYIKKYGNTIGLSKYNEIKQKRIDNLTNLVGIRCSKISQELFWLIHEQLNNEEKEKCFFNELNHEYVLKNGNSCFFIDFKCGNKVIEYDGEYWHKNRIESDTLRKDFYKRNNLKLLILTEKDFNRNNKKSDTIKKCLSFIRYGD
jgi:hypothetical protein